MKRQPSEWEKIFANESTDKGLTSKNIQTAHVAQYQNNRQSNQKWAEDLNTYFSEEDIQTAKKHMERSSTHSLSEKGKSKLQCGVASCCSEWPTSKNIQLGLPWLVQWLEVCFAMQATAVLSLDRENPYAMEQLRPCATNTKPL